MQEADLLADQNSVDVPGPDLLTSSNFLLRAGTRADLPVAREHFEAKSRQLKEDGEFI